MSENQHHIIFIPSSGKSLAEIEMEAIVFTLRLTRNNQSKAARLLGVSRPTMARKILKHGIKL